MGILELAVQAVFEQLTPDDETPPGAHLLIVKPPGRFGHVIRLRAKWWLRERMRFTNCSGAGQGGRAEFGVRTVVLLAHQGDSATGAVPMSAGSSRCGARDREQASPKIDRRTLPIGCGSDRMAHLST